MITKFLGKLGLNSPRRVTERDLIKAEAKVGATLFGPVPEGHKRDFFCLDSKTWVWHEEWTEPNGKTKSLTTRYEVRPNGILKIQDGYPYSYITGQELVNLAAATRQYREQVATKVYNRPATV